MSTQKNMESAEGISLGEMVDLVREEARFIALGITAGTVLAFGIASFIPKKYEASGNIQVAKVANSDVESPAVLVEKLKLPMYYSAKTLATCGLANDLDPGRTLSRALNPLLSIGGPLVRISYRSTDIGVAKACLQSVLGDIRSNQAEMARPLIETRQNQLANLKAKLEASEKITKELLAKAPDFNFSDNKFSAYSLLLATTLKKQDDVKDLRMMINNQEIALSEPQTKEASLTTPIYAPLEPVEPRIAVVTFFGGLLGMMLALALAMSKKATHRKAPAPTSARPANLT